MARSTAETLKGAIVWGKSVSIKKWTIAVVTAGLLAGCAVSPKLLNDTEIATFATDRYARVTAEQEPVRDSVDLYEAMARALKYNLDAKVEVAERVLRETELNVANYSLLPKLVADTGYAGRSDVDISTSSNRDDEVITANLTFSWNILDFGLSYVRAKQAADKVLAQEEVKRKIVNRVIEDVRTAYWRAVSYERLVKRLKTLEGRVQTALADTRQLETSGQTSPIAALTYERELLEIQREIENLEGDLNVAKTQLAALMNLEPGVDFQLEVAPRKLAALTLPGELRQMFRVALRNRPEMRELAYQLRAQDRELDAALLDLLPGLTPYAGLNYDSNDFITSNSWVSWGAKASWNLMKVFSYPAVKRKAEAGTYLLDERSLSVAMAIMTQVHVSRARFLHQLKSYRTASELASVQHKLLKQIRAETAAQRTSEQILIREEMNTLLADAKVDTVYADLQNAYANIYASIGLDPFPAGLDDQDSIESMSARLRDLWIERGKAQDISVADAE
jgi:outer membrane protein TolC